ncbi:MAG: hypothetical protein IH874_03555 [Candidatus Dadabacteria bacterium]|nr:hypothetical protein [Candidatus Dadabacteria bacterium]
MKDINMEGMGIERQAGQMLMPRLDFRPGDPLPLARELVRDCHVGGFIVFGGEIERLSKATAELQCFSDIPLFFALDAERGVGQTVKGGTVFPHIMSLGAAGDEELAGRQGAFTAREMKGAGLNMAFAPVVDVNTNPANPIINVRSFGDDPLLVSRLGSAFIRGVQGEGVGACAKHFPGHGGTDADSHEALPVYRANMERLTDCELIPFKGAVEAGVSSIMTAHISNLKIDGTGSPATLSPLVVGELLLGRLRFDGLVITDSFRMEGVKGAGSEADAVVTAVSAGCNIILDPEDPKGVYEALIEAVSSGEMLSSMLKESVRKILFTKGRYITSGHGGVQADADTGRELCLETARRSVCRLKGGGLERKKARVFILDVTSSGPSRGRAFIEVLEEAGFVCRRVDVNTSDSGCVASGRDEAAVCVVYTGVAAWKEITALPDGYKEFLKGVSEMGGEKILVSLGSPYVLSGMSGFDTVIGAFDGLECVERAAARVLLERAEPRGRMPVKVEL